MKSNSQTHSLKVNRMYKYLHILTNSRIMWFSKGSGFTVGKNFFLRLKTYLLMTQI